MDKTNKGKRVALVHCTDPYTDLKCGDTGTVLFEDDIGTTHIKWDKGGSLGMTLQDSFIFLEEESNG